MQEKVCSDCGQMKPVSEFNMHKATPDGYEKRCRACRNRKVEEDRANRAFCEAMRKQRYDSIYPTPQFIYGLVDPRTGELRYIGHSYDPAVRLQTHANKGSGENRKLRDWISELQAGRLRPNVRVMERVDEREFVLEREFRWIVKGMRDGLSLLNAEAHTGNNPQRNPCLIHQVRESQCADFLTEPRMSPLLQALDGWRHLTGVGDGWFRKPFPLREAIRVCLKMCPDELPPRLFPEVEKLSQGMVASRTRLQAIVQGS